MQKPRISDPGAQPPGKHQNHDATVRRARCGAARGLLALCGLALAVILAHAQTAPQRAAAGKQAGFGYPPNLPEARAETYKTIGETQLQLYVFTPKDHLPSQRRPAILFFFGGGWSQGSPKQFEQQCRYLAARGLVAISADYRVATRHQVKPAQCVADAKSAIRWVRKNAPRLGIDPQRLAAGGGSAGGHLAAATAFLPGLDEAGEETTVSAVPNALVLFNPALILAPLEGKSLEGFGTRLGLERLGAKPEDISPGHHIRPGGPPAIIFHGRADTTVPFVTAERFAERMKAAGNRCELVGFDGQPHGFFNFGRNEDKFFLETLRCADEFLASLGFLSGKPTVDEFFAAKPRQ